MRHGLKLVSYFSLALSLAFLLTVAGGRDVHATTWNSEFAATLTDSTPAAMPDTEVLLDQASPNANFGKVDNAVAPEAFIVSPDAGIPQGAAVGVVDAIVNLGLINGPCITPVPVSVPLMDATTDITDIANYEAGGENLVHDDDGDGVPNYADHYIGTLNLLTDPDGLGIAAPIVPRARYAGHVQVVPGAPPTIVNVLVFNPGDLTALGLPEGGLVSSYGYASLVVLNDPFSRVPSTITDFCTGVTTVTTLYGETAGQYSVVDGHAPFEVSSTQCDSSDNDGDGDADEGCLVLDAGTNAGIDRAENPAANTGIFGTSTHVLHSFTQAIRDADDDFIDNALDTCPYTPNNGVDNDADGLDSACDPNDLVPSPLAAPPDGIDNDGDNGGLSSDGIDNDGDSTVDEGDEGTDEDPVNNFDDDGDTLLDEDGDCPDTSGAPDEDQDCYINRGDNCPLVANPDQADFDEFPSAADAGTPWDGIGDVCDANPPGGEPVGQCNNAIDDDVDGIVNDGCPAAGTRPEVGVECLNTLSDDISDDALVNDGCPAVGGGDADGHYHSNAPIAYYCIGGTDTDGDGACDATETLLGSNPGSPISTPEFGGLVLDSLPYDGDGDTVITPANPYDVAPQVCNDHALYNHPDGARVDNDDDGTQNDADDHAGAGVPPAAGMPDSGCSSPVVGNPPDTDHDGVGDDVDNCTNDDNPNQLDTDGDGDGDGCDNDDDDDTINDIVESYMGTDPKDNCSDDGSDPANPSDLDNNTQVNVGDLVQAFGGGKILKSAGDPLYSRRSDFNADQQVNVGDLVIAFGNSKVLTECDLNLSSGPWSLPDNEGTVADCPNVSETITLTFHSRAITLPSGSVTDDQGGTYGAGTILASPNQNQVQVTRTGGTDTGASCTVNVDDVNNRRTPVLIDVQ